ncbi:hypothetical protein N431DRAFT_463216 [Stipitochalara longipes BDJ]|nr:hypothetical protein N431DRAFT_463216 [Stipitochalara longipes BDJ]
MKSNLDQTMKETQDKAPPRKEFWPSDAFARPQRPENDPAKYPNGTQHKSPTNNIYQLPHIDPSRPPRTDIVSVKTAFTNPHDIHMASRQTQYESLAPEEQKKQEERAQKK